MQCGVLDWIVQKKKDITEITSEIQVKSVVYALANFLVFTNIWLSKSATLGEDG